MTEAQRIVLAKRPVGAPADSDFRLESFDPGAPGDGEILLQTLWLSLDPYMRGRISDAKSYAAKVEIGDAIVGATVSRVIASNHPGFAAGDLVLGQSGWRTHEISAGAGLTKLDPGMERPSLALGVLGMPGFTAWRGLMSIGEPKAGETVCVAAATGPVGATVAQIAKLKGCRVIAIAGGADKVAYARDTLKADAALDHRAPDFAARLAEAAPDGIDVYFENVGGAVLEAVIPLMNTFGRMPVCGTIAWYNMTAPPPGPDKTPVLMRAILTKRLRAQGFIIADHWSEFPAFLAEMGPWLRAGKIIALEDVVEGLANAPRAFMGLLEGRNFGKLVVKVAD
ncbi:MAG: NADP-dependent oxidoreductase [Rhizobiales bacterium 65-9]|nr:NADP-dependent oxidoreductase [Hyphomicrobiales bacterium]OJY37230.1 MAG: NADP-dependent oxidoreductase [Rhizobiales bacterium 65-9]